MFCKHTELWNYLDFYLFLVIGQTEIQWLTKVWISLWTSSKKKKNELIEKTEQLVLEYQEHSNIELQFSHTFLPHGIYILGVAVRCLYTGTFHLDTFVFTQFDNIVERVVEVVRTFIVFFILRSHIP